MDIRYSVSEISKMQLYISVAVMYAVAVACVKSGYLP